MSRFGGRALGKAERVTTIAAHVLHESAAARDVVNAMAAHNADGRMSDVRHIQLGLEKRVAAVACELAIAVAIADHVHVVTEQSAEVADFLVENSRVPVRIRVGAKQQRVAALHADVLRVPVALDEFRIRVMAEKARQRMADVRRRAVLAEVLRTAPALWCAVWGHEVDNPSLMYVREIQ